MPTTENYITQSAGDARYQTLGGLSSGTPTTVDAGDTGTAGVSSSASRADHEHPVSVTSAQLVPAAAIAAWTSYTPTLTQGGAVTKTVTYAKYLQFGKMVTVTVNLLSTGVGTAGQNVVVGLPITAANANAIVGSFRYLDSGTALWVGTCFGSSTTTVVLQTANVAAEFGQSPAVTMAANDTVQISVTYEAA